MSLSTSEQKRLKEIFGEDVEFDLPLAPYTTIRVGGKADAILWPKDIESLQKAIQFAKEATLPTFFMGRGSNTLVRDGGFRGVVIHTGRGLHNFSLSRENGNFVWVTAEGGVPTQQLVQWAAENGFSGLERLAGIPGTIGGNVFMNAGTYLGEIGELIEQVTLCDRNGKVETLPKSKLSFFYRRSNIPSSSCVVETLLKLERGDKEKISKKVREVFEKRGLSQPLEKPNLGSVFKNPGLPSRGQGKKKAWELIEEAGCKGVRVGGARVSEKHANFIVNEGNAKAKDILVLIHMIKEKVKEASGETLETEVKIIGEE